MPTHFTSTLRGLMIVAALAPAVMSSAARAYTQDQQQLCMGDAMRLCSSEIPDVDRITACMARQRHALSPGCRAVFRVEPPASSTPVSMRR